MKLNYLTIKEALIGLGKKEFSAIELVKACLDQIKKSNKELNALITVCEEEALKQAKELDNKEVKKPLHGIPIVLKDLYVTKNIKTTAGSKVLENYAPRYDATAVKRLKQAGAVILGKTNLDAWGHGASGENSDFGPTKNPWNKAYVSGGSSSGSAIAVSAGMCLVAGGTDTGGSVRAPASFCGVVGLKPTYGRVSRYGIIAMASSLDSIGHLTRTTWDSVYYLKVVAGSDNCDATMPHKPVHSKTSFLLKEKFSLKNLKIGIPKEYFVKELNKEVKTKVEKAIKILKTAGAKTTEISLPHTEYGVATYYIVMPSEVSSNLARYDGIRFGSNRSFFGDEAKRRIMLGTYSLSAGYYDAFYKKAMGVRTFIRKDFEKAFQKVDCLVAPVMSTPPFKLGEKQRPLDMYLADIFTAPSNLAGIPSLAVPCGFSKNKLPIGMQIIGPQFSEDLLFKVGYVYQQITDWHLRKPRLTQIKNEK